MSMSTSITTTTTTITSITELQEGQYAEYLADLRRQFAEWEVGEEAAFD